MCRFNDNTPYLWRPEKDGDNVKLTLYTRKLVQSIQTYQGDRGTDYDIHKLYTNIAKQAYKQRKAAATKASREEVQRALDRRIDARASSFSELFGAYNSELPQSGYVLLRPVEASKAGRVKIEGTLVPSSQCSSETTERSQKRIRLHTSTDRLLISSPAIQKDTSFEYELVAGSLFATSPGLTQFTQALQAQVELEILGRPLVTQFDKDAIATISKAPPGIMCTTVEELLRTHPQRAAAYNWLDPREPLRRFAESNSGILFFFKAEPGSWLAQQCRAALLEFNPVDDYHPVEYKYQKLNVHTEWQIRSSSAFEPSRRPFSRFYFRTKCTNYSLQNKVIEAIEGSRGKPDITKIATDLGADSKNTREVKDQIAKHFNANITSLAEPETSLGKYADYILKVGPDTGIYAMTESIFRQYVCTVAGHAVERPLVCQPGARVDAEPPVPTGEFEAGLVLDDTVDDADFDAAPAMVDEAFDRASAPYTIDRHYKSHSGYAHEYMRFVKQTLATLFGTTSQSDTDKQQLLGTFSWAHMLTPLQNFDNFMFVPGSNQIIPDLQLPIRAGVDVNFPVGGPDTFSTAALTVNRYIVEEALSPTNYFDASQLYDYIGTIIGSERAFGVNEDFQPFVQKVYHLIADQMASEWENSLHLIQESDPSGDESRRGSYAQPFEPLVVEMHRAQINGSKLEYCLGLEATPIVGSIQLVSKLLLLQCTNPINDSSEAARQESAAIKSQTYALIDDEKNDPTATGIEVGEASSLIPDAVVNPKGFLDDKISIPTLVNFPSNSDQVTKESVLLTNATPISNMFVSGEGSTESLDMKAYFNYVSASNVKTLNRSSHITVQPGMAFSFQPTKLALSPGSLYTISSQMNIRVDMDKLAKVNVYCEALARKFKNPHTRTGIACALPLALDTDLYGYIYLEGATLTQVRTYNEIKYAYLRDGTITRLKLFDTGWAQVDGGELKVKVNSDIIQKYGKEFTAQEFTFSVKKEEANRNFKASQGGASPVESIHTRLESDSLDSKALADIISKGCQGIHHSTAKSLTRTTFCVLINQKKKEVLDWLQGDSPDDPRGIPLDNPSDSIDKLDAHCMNLIRDGERNRQAQNGQSIQYGGRERSALVVSAVVLVKSGRNSLATACRVDGYGVKSSVYRLTEVECIRRLSTRLASFRNIPSVATPRCLAYVMRKMPPPYTIRRLLANNGSIERANYLAKLMLLISELTLVQNRPQQGVSRASLQILMANLDAAVDDCLFA